MKIIAAVCVYNRENFIAPYLEMLLEFGIEPVVTFGYKPWVNHSTGTPEAESDIPDKTETILDTYFKDVKTIKGIFSHHRDSINQCIPIAGDYDIMLVSDCDMFITKEDWGKQREFIEDNRSFDTYAINHERMITEYRYDWRFGREAIKGGTPPIIAMRQGISFRHMTQTTSNNKIIWDVDGPKYHHMRWCKKDRSDDVSDRIPDISWNDSPAPPEIFDRLDKWQKIVENM